MPDTDLKDHSGLWDLSASRKAFCQQPAKSDLREHRNCSPGALEILEWLGQTTATVTLTWVFIINGIVLGH